MIECRRKNEEEHRLCRLMTDRQEDPYRIYPIRTVIDRPIIEQDE